MIRRKQVSLIFIVAFVQATAKATEAFNSRPLYLIIGPKILWRHMRHRQKCSFPQNRVVNWVCE